MVYSPGTLFNIPANMRTSLGKKRNFTPSLRSVRASLNRVVSIDNEIKEARQRANKLQHEYRRLIEHDIPKLERVRIQLARRVAYPGAESRGQNLLTERLTNAERARMRTSARITKNMSSALRTIKHLPIPRNIGLNIVRRVGHMS